MAIAGFSPDEVELTQDGPELIVIGQKKPNQEDRQVLHQGLAIGDQGGVQACRSVKVAGCQAWRMVTLRSIWFSTISP